jgi:hypothetical protein
MAGTGGAIAGGGGTTGEAGSTGGGEGGADAGAAGHAGAECSRDADCVAIDECYSAACKAGVCVGSPLSRGSACDNGYCNGFARCLPCLDDAQGSNRDTGCSANSPLCAETAFEPTCVGCEEDADCNDGIECTVDRCNESVCESLTKPVGSACSAGICDGEAKADSCAPCIDDASTGLDTGCTTAQPKCDTEQTPAACSACKQADDCDDGNECTTDGCDQGVCEHLTLVSGTPCDGGYCNGVPGVELCVAFPCKTDADCDDGVACTVESCESLHCAYSADHDECPDSGDVCTPNRCTVGTGCQAVDVARSADLLKNGDFEAGHVDWIEKSSTYDQVIFVYGYIPTLQPHTSPYVAWLGGGEGGLDESNSLAQVVHIPAGTVRLELTFFYEIWTEEGLPDDHNRLQVSLLSTESSQTDEELVTFHNQDATRVWRRFTTTIDPTPWAGSDATLYFSGTGIDGFTHFFVDSISLVATVCE